MHEHDEILLKYMLKCHLGPTQTQTNKMGHSLNKGKKMKNISFSQPFQKHTQPYKSYDLRLNLRNQK